jgi:3-oxoacyl-[acyl-carrier protein] reductase
MPALAGKAALVTGAGRGIGRATALLFAREGASVVVVSRSEAELRELVSAATTARLPGVVSPIVADVRTEEAASRCVDVARRDFGGLDVLVNNAGIAVFKPIWECDVVDYDDQMDTNMRATFLFTRAAVQVFLERGGGTVVNVASMAGVKGYPELSAYCASKFAQVGFSRALDRELRSRNVSVACILPGATRTEIAGGRWGAESGVPAEELLDPEEVARAILFAASRPEGSRILELRLRSMGEDD